MKVGDTQYGGNLDLNYNKIINATDRRVAVPSGVIFDNREDFELIAHTELSADAANIEFTNIPGRYRHLMLITNFEDTVGTTRAFSHLQFNGDTAANYDSSYYDVNDSATLGGTGDDGPGVARIVLGAHAGSNLTNVFSPHITMIPDYSNTVRHKSAHSINGWLQGTAAGDIRAAAASGRWRNTNAITSILVRSAEAGNALKSGSTASLYGIRSKRFLVDPTNTLCNSLIAYWKLDETGGKRLDSWGANHLTDNNTVTYGRGLRGGNAARFSNANSEYLSVADNTDISTGDVDFTIACWAYFHTVSSDRLLVSHHNGPAANSEGYLLNHNLITANRLSFRVRSVDNLSTASASWNEDTAAGRWYFIVAWHDASGDQIGIQVDNRSPVTTSFSGGVRDSTEDFRIGVARDNSTLSWYYGGLIQNVGFWKKVLTPAERTALWNQGKGNTLVDA